jgi:sugar porter (SP) family MFS transporter
MIVGAVIQAACQDLGGFMGGRALLGFGNSLAQISSPMLLTEIAHPQHRARLTTIYNCLWNVGALIVAWVSFGTNYIPNDWSWRIPALLQAIPSVIQLAFIFWVPESPRFLMAKDKHEQALNILAKYHANGDVNNATVQFEYREIKETIRLEFEASKSSSYMDFFKTKGNRYRFYVLISLGIFSQWSGNAIISNYASKLYDSAGITNSTQKLGLSAGQTCMSLIVSLSMAMLVDKFGRRPMFLAATAGMFGTFIFWTLTSGLYDEYGSPGANYAMLFFIWIFSVFYSLAWSGLLVGYAIEILPYKLRAKGLMIMNMTVQAALTLNAYANPVAFEAFTGHTWKLYLIYTVSCLASKPAQGLSANSLTSSAGSSSSCASCTSCTLRPRAPPLRSWPRSLTVMRPRSVTSTSARSRRRPTSTRRRSPKWLAASPGGAPFCRHVGLVVWLACELRDVFGRKFPLCSCLGIFTQAKTSFDFHTMLSRSRFG